jgi:hypothetical protein
LAPTTLALNPLVATKKIKPGPRRFDCVILKSSFERSVFTIPTFASDSKLVPKMHFNSFSTSLSSTTKFGPGVDAMTTIFSDFPQISAKKLAFLLKTDVTIHFFA